MSLVVTLAGPPDSLWPRRAEWNALVSRATTDTVFQTLEWTLSWWRVFGAQARPLVLLALDGGRLVGAAPLMLSTRRILGRRCRVVEFIGTDAADYCDFIAEPGAAAAPAMVEWLAAHRRRWDLLRLVNIAETSPLLSLLPARFAPRERTLVRRLYECPSVRLADRAEAEKLLRNKSIREGENKLRRQGVVEFRVHARAADIAAQLPAFFRQHEARWAATATPSFFSDPRQRAFYGALTELLAPRGWVLFSVLACGAQPVSFHFGFAYGGRVYVIKHAYDPAFRHAAPGLLQIKHLLAHALGSGSAELDFTTGEEPYKYRFANHARVNYVVNVHGRGLFHGLDRLLALARSLARRSPACLRLAKRVLKPRLGSTLSNLGL